jgi:endogenous inhibitor of DNA gyrase (YacG/DUF329 family)
MNLVRCPSCGLLDDWKKNPLKPFCSEVCRLLWRYGLAWRIQPYRIVVDTRPHLIVQAGPDFDLSESELKGARERTLATERKRRQRENERHRDVTPTAQYNEAIQGSDALLGVEKAESSLGGVQRGA